MRHLKSGTRLNMDTAQRRAVFRNLMTALFANGKIVTTLAKAKAMRSDTEKLITRAKKENLQAMRIILQNLTDKEVAYKLFNGYAKLYQTRNGGYTRIYKIGNRLGDNAQMALIELVDYQKLQPTEKPEGRKEKYKDKNESAPASKSKTKPAAKTTKVADKVKAPKKAAETKKSTLKAVNQELKENK